MSVCIEHLCVYRRNTIAHQKALDEMSDLHQNIFVCNIDTLIHLIFQIYPESQVVECSMECFMHNDYRN